MTRMALVLRGSLLRIFLLLASCALTTAFWLTPVALAQHGGGGGHGGGFGGGHFGGGHVSAPHGSALPSAHGTTTRARGTMFVPPARFGPRSFLIPTHPIHRYPFPIFWNPVFFGAPFFWYGGSYWWPPCGPFWGAGCYWPSYGWGYGGYGGWGWGGYDNGNYAPPYPYSPSPAAPVYEYAPYLGGARDFAELFFKDGTVYDVMDYWLVEGQLHFTTLDEKGEKAVEHVRSFDDLDLQTTVDVNTQRGFKFMLRNEPIEQYFRDHPEIVPKVDPDAPRN